jgi:toxin YhaV
MGLPQRYRLFFRAFAERKVVTILLLGFPRTEGDRRDCYQVFSRMVANGKLPDSYESPVAAFDLEDEITNETELADEIDRIDTMFGFTIRASLAANNIRSASPLLRENLHVFFI